MSSLLLLWRNLWRARLRTAFTLASVAIAFVLFALLQTVQAAFDRGATVAGTHRLLTSSLYAITESLPLAHRTRMQGVTGVKGMSTSTWFGASFQDPQNRFPMFAVDHRQHFALLQELNLPPEDAAVWQSTRRGVVLGQKLAERLKLKRGDPFPVKSEIWLHRDGRYVWDLEIVGIFTPKDPEQDARGNSAYLRQDFFDESRVYAQNSVSMFLINVDPAVDPATVAQRIDGLFANSPNETRTQTEAAFSQSFAKQLGDIGLVMRGILAAVFFTLVMLTGNTLMNAVRERTAELATLKALGFSDARVLVLVLLECALLMGVGALLGLALGAATVYALEVPLRSIFPVFAMPPATWGYGLAWAAVLAVIVGLLPAWRALRIPVAEALRR